MTDSNEGSSSTPQPEPDPRSPGAANPNPAAKGKISVVMGPGIGSEGMHWLCYAGIRYKYIQEHLQLYEGQSGMLIPSFEEEVMARTYVAQSCAQQLQLGQRLTSAYFSDLLKVYQKGFVPEYVWHFLAQPIWREEARPKNLAAFLAWSKIYLNKHTAQTHSGVSIQRDNPAPADSKSTTPPPPVEVKSGKGAELQGPINEAFAAFQQGNHPEALRKLDAIHQATRSLQDEAGVTYLCIQNQNELNFFVSSHPEIRSIRVLPWSIAEALFARIFILSHHRNFTDACQYLDELIRLAPLMARAHRQKGYVLTKLRRPTEALKAFSIAWDLVGRLTSNASEAGSSLRGMAVVLIDLGNLDLAEKLLQDSLLVEPGNAMANNELLYIAKVRREGKPASISYQTFSSKRPGN